MMHTNTNINYMNVSNFVSILSNLDSEKFDKDKTLERIQHDNQRRSGLRDSRRRIYV